ncbi:site-2 protease family protein [Elioraea thermophila]|uniref:site-2 protease family protein n=1 Tax=Elioraea thermophila TaxID=2185104 RepID=UPI000DF48697|nr:site-2 protease family protein [Elioraea thermophila]
MIENILIALLVIAPGALIAIILHEVAHGWAADALGDPTARERGRLSLNPLRHLDPFGTVALPLLLFGLQMLSIGRVEFLFGWAKPVPVDPRNFRRPRQDMALVAAAGPAINLALAFAIAALGHVVDLLPRPADMLAVEAILFAVQINLLLMLFNLIPIPPLDGGRILVGVLPLGPARALARLEPAGLMLVLLGLFVLPAFLRLSGVPFDPLSQLLLPPLAALRRLVFTAVGL